MTAPAPHRVPGNVRADWTDECHLLWVGAVGVGGALGKKAPSRHRRHCRHCCRRHDGGTLHPPPPALGRPTSHAAAERQTLAPVVNEARGGGGRLREGNAAAATTAAARSPVPICPPCPPAHPAYLPTPVAARPSTRLPASGGQPRPGGRWAWQEGGPRGDDAGREGRRARPDRTTPLHAGVPPPPPPSRSYCDLKPGGRAEAAASRRWNWRRWGGERRLPPPAGGEVMVVRGCPQTANGAIGGGGAHVRTAPDGTFPPTHAPRP